MGFFSSVIADALYGVLAYVVLDAMFTAFVAWRVNKFELRSFSLYLEKIGTESAGLVLLGAATYFAPAPALAASVGALFAGSLAIFTAAEAAGVKDKVAELFGGPSAADVISDNPKGEV